MAANKESVVIIVDVGIGAEELTKAATECSLKVLQNKIFNSKLDLVSFLLLRTEETENKANNEEPNEYLNICQLLPGSQIPTWYMAKELVSALDKQKSKNGDWVDALVAAIGIITEDAAIHKTRLSKIVLFHNFDGLPSSLDSQIVDKLNEMDLKLIIVSNNIHYIPDSDGNLRPEFKAFIGKSPSQIKNEELAMRLVKNYPSTTLCNFKDALPFILRKHLVRPWTWNSTLAIGTRIVIQVSGVIAVKEEGTVPKFQRKSKEPNEVIKREKNYYSGVDELPDHTAGDCITGYMLGDTPMPYDPSLGQAKIETKRGIHFIGFVSEQSIPQEHFSGQSTYVVFAQKGKRVSAKLMDSLVRAMRANGVSILAWKVYNNGQKPKLAVLLPTLEYELAGLSMIELSYHSQHRFWDFPKLDTKKNHPTSDQLAAVDELMAAMDLSPKQEEDQKPCDSISKDYLPFEYLPNIRHQHIIDYVASSVFKESSAPPADLIKVPDVFQPKASAAAAKIKSVFTLEKTDAPTKEKLKKHFNSTVNADQATNDGTTSTAAIEEFKLTHVGTVTPAEDFTALISHIFNEMPSGAERAAKFHQYACQMRSVISDLLFKSMTKQNEKIEKALVAYRKVIIAANSSYDYNDWMKEIRRKVIERKMFDFWEEVIVKQKLGLYLEDEDAQAEEDFYDISKEQAAVTNVDALMEDDEDVEDLFGNM